MALVNKMLDIWAIRSTDVLIYISVSCVLLNGVSMSFIPQPPSSALVTEPISMRVPDACRFTGISRSTLYLLISRGEIEIVKVGAATLVLTESLRELIERHRARGGKPGSDTYPPHKPI